MGFAAGLGQGRSNWRQIGRILEGDRWRFWHSPDLYVIVICVEPAPTSSVVSVRVSADERAMFEAAAEQAHTSLSDFMRRKAMEAAEAEVPQRSIVTISAASWDAFEAWVDRPAEPHPALAEMMGLKPVWQS